MAIDAGVRELYLYHHDPNYDDNAINIIHQKSEKIIKDRNSDMQCYIAREGMRIDL